MMNSSQQSLKKKSSIPSRSIYDEYFEYDTTYKSKYGDKTCVLLEVGSFFEIYTYKTLSTNIVQHPQTHDISSICSLSLVEKKATYKTNDQQIMMMGFRNYMLDKYLQKLVNMDYTIVVYVQEKDGKNVTRKLDAIYSRGTFIRYDDNDNSYDNTSMQQVQQMQYMVCIWIDIITPILIKKKNKVRSIVQQKILYGISAINIFTGHSVMFEYETPFIMNPTTFDEMERFLSTFSPSEIIVISNTIEKSVIQTILRYAGVLCNTIHVYSKESFEPTQQPATSSILTKIKNCEKQTYIQSILSTYFDNQNIYFQYDDFQRNPTSTQSFCYLLDFIKEHNINLIRKIAIPTFTNTSNRMVLANHTLRQLNIINDNSNSGAGVFSSVLSFMNRCSTSIGKRLFQRKLLNPTFDVDWLNQEYNKIEDIIRLYDIEQLNEIRSKLNCIKDIEKIYRQIVSRKIYPSVIFQLYNSIDILQYLQSFFKETGGDCFFLPLLVNEPTVLPQLFKEFLNKYLYIDVCKYTNTIQVFEKNIIQPQISDEIDKLLLKKDKYANQLTTICEYFNQLMRSSIIKEKGGSSISSNSANQTEYVKIHETEKSGVSLQITTSRAVILKKILASKTDENLIIPFATDECLTIPLKEIRIISSTNSCNEVTFPFISSLSHNILKTEEYLNIEISKTYNGIIEIIECEWSSAITQYIEYIGNMDLLITKAYIAKKYGYCKPSIVNDDKITKSFLKATKMRHCLIEHLQTNEIYVPNDVTLGIENEDGILLFGTNAIGKTSLIRSIGVCIVLAQAGLYVPCETFLYKPYTALFSRIIGNDNLFKNLSTFQVEISELAVILKQADSNSLILGDEICSSTEMESGLSIIMASLIEFHSRKASFIFATHFHEIVRWEEMKRLTNIKVKHLEVSFDQLTGKLMYDRKLKDGMGITSYGLTVCQSMNLPTDFLDNAFEIRNHHYPENGGILTFSHSKYNSKKLIGICENCNIDFSTEIHHIHPQKNADYLGVIRTENGHTFHKNHTANLRSLCEKCHKQMHF